MILVLYPLPLLFVHPIVLRQHHCIVLCCVVSTNIWHLIREHIIGCGYIYINQHMYATKYLQAYLSYKRQNRSLLTGLAYKYPCVYSTPKSVTFLAWISFSTPSATMVHCKSCANSTILNNME